MALSKAEIEKQLNAANLLLDALEAKLDAADTFLYNAIQTAKHGTNSYDSSDFKIVAAQKAKELALTATTTQREKVIGLQNQWSNYDLNQRTADYPTTGNGFLVTPTSYGDNQRTPTGNSPTSYGDNRRTPTVTSNGPQATIVNIDHMAAVSAKTVLSPDMTKAMLRHQRQDYLDKNNLVIGVDGHFEKGTLNWVADSPKVKPKPVPRGTTPPVGDGPLQYGGGVRPGSNGNDTTSTSNGNVNNLKAQRQAFLAANPGASRGIAGENSGGRNGHFVEGTADWVYYDTAVAPAIVTPPIKQTVNPAGERVTSTGRVVSTAGAAAPEIAASTSTKTLDQANTLNAPAGAPAPDTSKFTLEDWANLGILEAKNNGGVYTAEAKKNIAAYERQQAKARTRGQIANALDPKPQESLAVASPAPSGGQATDSGSSMPTQAIAGGTYEQNTSLAEQGFRWEPISQKWIK